MQLYGTEIYDLDSGEVEVEMRMQEGEIPEPATKRLKLELDVGREKQTELQRRVVEVWERICSAGC